MHTETASELVPSRHDWLLERLARDRRITTNGAATELGVSVDTIRRDLRHLHDRGLVRRVHGGAVKTTTLSASFTERSADDSAERNKLAAAIVATLRPGQVIGLDAGTTATAIAATLPDSLEVTIVTNSPAVAMALADHPAVAIVLVGGAVDLRWMAITGPTAVDAIRRHHLDLGVVGVCSFDATAGATTRSQHEVATKRALIEASAEVLVPVESNKLGTISPFHIAGPTDVAIAVVESATNGEHLTSYYDAGIEIFRA